MIHKLLKYYADFLPFHEQEAWALFRIAAIAEAIGWTLLIVGIVLRDHVLAGNNAPVAVAGRIHGMLFVAYIIAVLALSSSLRWPVWRLLIAGLCSVPPYGSLIYEQISGRLRQRRELKHLQAWAGYTAAVRQNKMV